MEPDFSGPADTAAMRIVHAALRRDYARARTALTQPPYPDDAQRAALCEHLSWMAGFLRRHHESEDGTLYPMVAAANPAAAALIDSMAADHDAIQGALDAAERAVVRYARSADGRADLAAALGSLEEVLLDEYVYEALRAGASGFVLKDDPAEQLISAVRTVAAGNALLSPAITKHVIRQFTRIARLAPPKELGELTDRERETLRLIAAGLSNAEIGRELYISETTVKTHVTHILQKLGLRDRVQAVVLAYQAGLFERALDE